MLWETYRALNEAIADICYPELEEPAPAYLTCDAAALEELAQRLGKPAAEARTAIIDMVLPTVTSGAELALSRMQVAQQQWLKNAEWTTPPPVLGFLLVTVMAAEQMGNDDDGMAVANYYGRLSALLRIPNGNAFQDEYRRWIEHFYRSLNRWLERFDGYRGLPTAYALRHRFVGFPMSQAVLRAADRNRLPLFFAEYGFAPGMDVAAEVIDSRLDAWLNSETCPASKPLKTLWSRTQARRQIAETVVGELIAWDGSRPDGLGAADTGNSRLRLVATMVDDVFQTGQTLRLGMVLYGREEVATGVEVRAADKWEVLTFSPVASGMWVCWFDPVGINSSLLMNNVDLRIRNSDGSTFECHRKPRAIVPFVREEITGMYVEQERIQLNADMLLMVRSDILGGKFAEQVCESASTVARPGYRDTHAGRAQVPSGWTLLSNLQMFASGDKYNELKALEHNQISLNGGLRHPSRIRKWSTLAAPELRVSVEDASALRLEILNEEDIVVKSFGGAGGALVQNLSDFDLTSGDYRIRVYKDVDSEPLKESQLRLRDSTEQDRHWILATRLIYQMGNGSGPCGVLTATPMHENLTPPYVDGSYGAYAVSVQGTAPTRTSAAWDETLDLDEADQNESIGTRCAKSCVDFPAHHIDLPTAGPGWQPKFVTGVCRRCGLVTRERSYISRRERQAMHDRQAGKAVSAAPQIAIQRMAQSQSLGSEALWRAALDSIMYMGGGGASSLKSLAGQVVPGPLFHRHFVAALEMLGHIAVERNEEGVPSNWEVSPACLVKTTRGFYLSGYWPRHVQNNLRSLLSRNGASLSDEGYSHQPPRRVIPKVSVDDLASWLAESQDEALVNAEIIEDAPADLLKCLPPLSELCLSISRVPLPGADRIEEFDVETVSWRPAKSASRPGAYRISRGFETMYIIRDTRDVEQQTAALTSAEVAKYFSAMANGVSLIYRDESNMTLHVPAGCELPGLYGRAMVSCSGVVPAQVRVHGPSGMNIRLAYENVNPTAASQLNFLLGR